MGSTGPRDPSGAGTSAGLKFLIITAAAALVALHLWCIVDAIRAGRSWLWVITLLIVPVVSPIAYLVARSPRKARAVLPRDRAPTPEKHAGFQAAVTQYNAGDMAGALATLDAMPPMPIQQNPEFGELLRAQVLVGLGRKTEAGAIYAKLVHRPPSWDVFYEYAQLLLDLARPGEARVVLEELERLVTRARRQPRRDEAKRYKWAMATLADLRG